MPHDAMASDLRIFVENDLRLHPRVAYQGLFGGTDKGSELAGKLPPMPPFRSEYAAAICVIDWDHRLPSQGVVLRIYAFYTQEAYAVGEAAFDDRLEEIGRKDKYPEFDVPDFEFLAADEAYDIELDIDDSIRRCRLTSSWRRGVDPADATVAVRLASKSAEFTKLLAENRQRPPHLGDLEAVSWTPPCESEHDRWTLDVWYLLSFDGRVGSGRSFLVDLESSEVVTVRDFSVRTS